MSIQLEVHKGSWKDGDVYGWVVPDFVVSSSIWASTNVMWDDPPTSIQPYYDANYTIFASNSTVAGWLLTSGIKNVFNLEFTTLNEYQDYYISENKYVRLTYSGDLATFKVPYYKINLCDEDGSIVGVDMVGQWSTMLSYNTATDAYSTFGMNNPKTITKAENGYFQMRVDRRSLSSALATRWSDWWAGYTPYTEDTDPYKQGGNSGTGGGTGTFSGTGDSIDFPSLPTLSAVSTGFITLFNPSISEMQNLATYMWGDVFDIGLYKTLFADPMDCILGCSIVPVAVPNGGTKTVNVGNVSTGISMTVAASQYVEVDCGTLNVEEFWGSYLDYDPYTKAEIYLPYCGTHAIQVDDIMGKAVHVKYHVDILSGACCAYVKCGSSVMYSFVGQCSSSIPISANDWTNVVNGALTIAASVGSLIATGGASAPMAVGAAAAVTGTIYGGGIKQNVEKSGSMGGTGGMLAVQTPYLILTRPRQALPKKQNTYTGYPSFITTKLEDLKGYTEIDSIRITGVPATDAELNELESILKSGVIF